ncbi:PAS domain-containing protein [bacterium]|nr:PAS domain-containing protein [bacterium]
MKKPFAFQHLNAQIAAKVGLITALLLGLLIASGATFLKRMLVERIAEDGRRVTASVAQELNADNLRAQQISRDLLAMQESGGFGQREAVLSLMQSLVRHTPNILATYVNYEPNADGQDARWRSHPAMPNGRFTPYWYRSGEQLRLTGVEDIDSFAFYSETKRLGIPFITEPYRLLGISMVSFTLPLRIDGRFVGITGTDLSLESINRAIARLPTMPHSHLLVLSPQGRLIVTPRPADYALPYASSSLAKLDWPHLSRLSPGSFAKATDPIDGKAAWVFSNRVSTGGWHVMLLVDEAATLRPLNHFLWTRALAATGILLALAAMLIWLIGRATRPLTPMAAACEALAQGDLHQVRRLVNQLGELPSDDEFGRMATAFRQAIAYLNELSAHFQRIARHDFSGTITPRGPHDQLGQSAQAMLSGLRDATEGLEARTRELEANRRSQAALLSNLPGMAYRCRLDPHWTMEFVSEGSKALTGYAPSDLVHNRHLGYTDLIHPDDRERVRQEVEASLVEHRPYRLVYRLRTADDRTKWVWEQGVSVLGEQPGEIRLEGLIIDISEQKRLEEALQERNRELQELDRLKSAFVNAVSHELRTPLTSIMGYTEFLEDEVGGALAAQQLEFVKQIQASSERLKRLIDDLLDFARIEAGTFRLTVAPFDLGDKVDEIVESFRPQAAQAQVTLISQIESAPLDLEADAQRIGQVLINLIGNALKFTPPGGHVTVRLKREADELVCEVEDDGPGIPPEDQAKLFQRFSQLEPGMRKGGTGLGLAISKALIEAHGGRIGVESSPGKGSIFWFRLPLARAGIRGAPAAST